MIWIKADTEPLAVLPSEYKLRDPQALMQALRDNPIPDIHLKATYHDGTPMLVDIQVKALDVSRWSSRAKLPTVCDSVCGTIVELAAAILDLPTIETTSTAHDGRVLWSVRIQLSRVASDTKTNTNTDTSNDANTGSADTSNDADADTGNAFPRVPTQLEPVHEEPVRTATTERMSSIRAQPVQPQPQPQPVRAVTATAGLATTERGGVGLSMLRTAGDCAAE